MADREKVIKAIDICLGHGGCNDCPYCFSKKGYATIKCCDDMFRDVLSLLKEQEKPNGKCVNECECWDSAYERGKQDALKEQEAVAPKTGHWIESKCLDECFWVCSECNFPSEAIAAPKLYKYCPNCGAKMERR